MSPDQSSTRILTLDVVRGFAVMGILAANIIGFAMPQEFYLNPAAMGTPSSSDLNAWLFSFLFVDGKMRGLFSLLFGASMLLVIERAEAANEASARVHFARMRWLLVLGLAHFYLIWFGDILALYAIAGMIAWFFHEQPPRALLRYAILLLLVQLLLFTALALHAHSASAAAAAPGASSAAIESWRQISDGFEIAGPRELGEIHALYRGDYGDILAYQFDAAALDPLVIALSYGFDTLAYMLLGMAALKTGFLSGAWSRHDYLRIATGGLALGLPASALLAWAVISDHFSAEAILGYSLAAATLVQALLVLAYAALAILIARLNHPAIIRIAAAGRTALSNYLGTSILMVTLFYGYGFGLFGTMGRAELWLVVLPTWALMLLWSKPWLDRFRYGPFEWLWRSLARGRRQPMRKEVVAA